MNKYKIHIEDGVIIVTLFGDESIRVFYFDAGNDEKGQTQELYDLLFSTGVDVDEWEG